MGSAASAVEGAMPWVRRLQVTHGLTWYEFLPTVSCGLTPREMNDRLLPDVLRLQLSDTAHRSHPLHTCRNPAASFNVSSSLMP